MVLSARETIGGGIMKRRRATNTIGPVGTRWACAIAATSALLLAAGCAGDGPGPGSGTTTTVPGSSTTTLVGSGVTIEDIQAQVFAPSCATSGCHDDVTRAGNLRLTSAENSYNELVGVPSACAARVRVVPGDAVASYLLHKLGSGPAPCGALMPIGAPALSGAALQDIGDWIAAGAAPPDASSIVVLTSDTSSTTTGADIGASTSTTLGQ